MKILKKVFLSLMKNYKKTILLIVIMFFMGILISTNIIVLNALENIEKVVDDSQNPNVTVKINHFGVQNPLLNSNQLDQLGQLPQVKYYDYAESLTVRNFELKNFNYFDQKVEDVSRWNKFYLTGVKYGGLVDLEQGLIELVRGRTLTQEEVETGSKKVLINEQIAKLNNLNIGDKITYNHEVYYIKNQDYKLAGYIPIELELIGTFELMEKSVETGVREFNEIINQQIKNDNNMLFTNSYTSILIINELAAEAEKLLIQKGIESNNNVFYDSVYVLKSHEDVPDFIEEAKAILGHDYKYEYSNKSYSSIYYAIETLRNVLEIVFIILIIITSFMLIIIITFFFIERMKVDQKFMFQMFLEVVFVAILAFSCSLIFSLKVTAPLSHNVIKHEITRKTDGIKTNYYDYYDYYNGMLDGKMVISSYKVALNQDIIQKMLLTSIGLVLVSFVIPICYRKEKIKQESK